MWEGGHQGARCCRSPPSAEGLEVSERKTKQVTENVQLLLAGALLLACVRPPVFSSCWRCSLHLPSKHLLPSGDICRWMMVHNIQAHETTAFARIEMMMSDHPRVQE